MVVMVDGDDNLHALLGPCCPTACDDGGTGTGGLDKSLMLLVVELAAAAVVEAKIGSSLPK